MFQYTTETIINSNVGRLASGKRFDVLNAEGESVINWSASPIAVAGTTGKTASDAFMVLIDGVNSLRIANIDKVYRAAFRDSKKASAILDLTGETIAANDIVRLTVTLREQGSVRSTIQNAYLHKSKPFHYEIAARTTSVADLVADLVKLIKKDMAMTDFAYFKAYKGTEAPASVTGASKAAELVLEADDCYIQFVDVKLEKVLNVEDPSVAASMPLSAKLLGINVVASPALGSLTKTAGDEGQGTVARLVKNLRIPTNASINPFAADQGGKPVPGGQYDQFLIEYVTDRHHVSGTVVGSVGEKSLTSHVLFMHQDVADKFAQMLEAVLPAGKLDSGHLFKAGQGNGAADVTNTTKGANVEVKDGKLALTSKPETGSVE